MLTAAEMMTTDLVTLRPEQRTYDAVKTLLRRRISGAPVIDEEGKLIGVFSERDSIQALLRAVHEQLPASRVGDHMSTDLITVNPDTTLLTIAHLFLNHTVRRTPVINEDGRLVGLISRRDLLTAAGRVMDKASTREEGLLYLSAVRERDSVDFR